MLHIGGENIEKDTGRVDGVRTAAELGLISGKYEFDEESILFSKIRPRLNKVAIPGFRGICSADIYPLKVKPGFDQSFVVHLLRSRRFLDYAEKHSTRTNIPKLNRKSLLAFEAPVPPLDEQRRIATILDRADAIRRKRREAIALTEELLRSTFLEMFGDPVTNPKGWPTKPLGKAATITTGNTPSRKDPANFGAHIEWIKTDNITGDNDVLTPAAESLSVTGRRLGREVREGAVLMACIAGSMSSIGKVAIADRGVTFNQQINALEPHPSVATTAFMYAMLSNAQQRVQEISTGGMKGLVSKGRLSKLELMFPPLSKQQSFDLVFDRYRGLRQPAESAAAEADDLFHSLVQRAFRGEL